MNVRLTDHLLLEIARCPIVALCLGAGGGSHPCAAIVTSQGSASMAEHQVPERWSGRIGESPLLFISSNPSISEDDVFPTGSWPDDAVLDFFAHRFGGGQRAWIRDGTKGLRRNGVYGKATMFWAGIRRRASELLQREAIPGIDYALTEVVHCKSRAEVGVAEASATCAARYLGRVVGAAHAPVLIVLGAHARSAVASEFGVPSDVDVAGPVEIGGKERMVTFLPHPNARAPRTFEACLSERDLRAVRAFLRAKD